jgi:hypothetical protein
MKLLLIVEKQKMDCFERHKIKGVIVSINHMPLTVFPMPACKKYTAFFGLTEIMKTGSNRQVPVGKHVSAWPVLNYQQLERSPIIYKLTDTNLLDRIRHQNWALLAPYIFINLADWVKVNKNESFFYESSNFLAFTLNSLTALKRIIPWVKTQ